jgi:hypothetical protein
MAEIITDEQRVQLRKEPRFEDMVRASIANHATYLHGLDGVSLPPGMSHEQWALQRFYIAEPIMHHPNDQDVQSWIAMFAMALKGFPVWDTDVDGTIDFMIANNTFEQLANQAVSLRAQNVKF